ncbi:2-(3-amino-3-carboxypropyl)histidine synthase subunit 2 [Anopheles nili]|uniref:2-(3-amino-3-carboxypropyl)histidine synthase subunit 2 n=1 Tax=Anopheles nili TaxID=185578 RepID=UPI00237B999F|nr:2-(3-amino-3-carboxypropyl)histidine synthase subunit 2 [Anopheles nili]
MSSAFSTSDSIEKNKCGSITEYQLLSEIWNDQQRDRCLRWIEKSHLKRIALQFPDNLLRYSVQMVTEVQTLLTEDVSIFVLGDTSYGSCCVDEIAASHATADGIIHFGHACLSKVAKIPVLYIFLNLTLNQDHLLDALSKTFPDQHSQFTCFYDVGYSNAVTEMKATLVNRFPLMKMAVLADTDEEPDVLCWKFDTPHVSDCPAVYIGKDNLSFFNTAVALTTSQWYLYDPNRESSQLEATDAVGAKWLRRRYYAIERCKDAGSIGIVVATLSTRGYLEIVSRIQRLAKAHGVRTYIISIGKVNPEKLANFIDIDCFVLVGCPENDTFTSRDTFFRPLVSVFEAEMALNPAWREKLCLSYTINFADLLPSGRLHSDVEEVAAMVKAENDTPDVSLITGRTRGARKPQDTEGTEPAVKDPEAAECSDVVPKGKNELAHISSADYFSNRSWQGLQQNLGQDEPVLIEEGRSGLPIKYENDPSSS